MIVAVRGRCPLLVARRQVLCFPQIAEQLQNLAFVLAAQANTSFEIIDRVQASLAERIAATEIHSPEAFEKEEETTTPPRELRLEAVVFDPRARTFARNRPALSGRLFARTRGLKKWPAAPCKISCFSSRQRFKLP